MRNQVSRLLCLIAVVAGITTAQATAVGVPLPEPRDVPFPGVIRLQVDATDVEQRVFRVKESVPVAGPGLVTLLYPRWLPGNHSPTGPVDKLAGLLIRGHGGELLDWQRDAVNTHAFHVDVPAGVTQRPRRTALPIPRAHREVARPAVGDPAAATAAACREEVTRSTRRTSC